MRQVFTSPRLENVEGVARLLEEAGIQVSVTNARSYKGNRRGTFSYRDSASTGPQPAVWVVKADDLTRARVVLRDAGLLQTTRDTGDSFLPDALRAERKPAPDPRRALAFRAKLVILAAIAGAAALLLMRMFS